MSTVKPDDTASLTHDLSRCDERGWLAFHERYYGFLHQQAVTRGVAPSEAPEVVQRVYLRVLRHAKVFQTADALSAWLVCLVRCEVIDTARRRTRRTWLNERFQQWMEAATPETPHPMSDQLAEAMATLAADERTMVTQHYFDGWSHERIAGTWRTTTKAVESKLARLRKRLRQHFPA